jgi:hypothetical protein
MAPYSRGSVRAQLARLCLIVSLLALPLTGGSAGQVAAPLIPLAADLVPLGLTLESVPCIPPALPVLAAPVRTAFAALPSAAIALNHGGATRLTEIESVRVSDATFLGSPTGRSPPSA